MPYDVVLDQMVGSGTTLIECFLTNRNGIGVDINQKSIDICAKNLSNVKQKNNKIKISYYEEMQEILILLKMKGLIL